MKNYYPAWLHYVLCFFAGAGIADYIQMIYRAITEASK